MDEKRIAELRKFVGKISDPLVRPYIDLGKLSKAGTFSLAVQMASEHAVDHGDFSYLNSLLALLDGSSHAGELIASLRSKISFVLTDSKPRRFKKATVQDAENAARLVASRPGAPSKATAAKPAKKSPKKKPSDDLLDSRLMLPGSFGHGKRR